MTTSPIEPGPGPGRVALLVLAICALAFVATSPAAPSLDGYVIGEVILSGGESAERELRIHVDPEAGGGVRGTIALALQGASGLEIAYAGDVTLSYLGAADGSGEFPATSTFPVERCLEGCDLRYRIAIMAGGSVLPASVIRYESSVHIEYDYSAAARDPSLLRLELDGAASGPIAPLWSIVIGLVALAAGIAAGPRVHALLPPWRRSWPALALIGLAVLQIAVMVGGRLFDFLGAGYFSQFAGEPALYLSLVDPWSVGLLGTLAWGVRRGQRRWPEDRGSLLGLAAVAAVGLGGFWLAWWTTSSATVQPIVLAVEFALLGALGGIVIGQAWRVSPRSIPDPWWVSAAVISHEITIAGFGFLAPLSLYDPTGTVGYSFLALIPAGLVALAFKRWLAGRQGWLALLDVLIALVGLLGLWLVVLDPITFATGPARLTIEDVAITIAVGASLVAFGTSLHSRRGLPGNAPSQPVELVAAPGRPLAFDDPPAT